jgi:calcium-dependent protein kinase
VKKEWFIKTNTGRVDEKYEIDAKKVLGSGTCGQVLKARIKNTKMYRAIKIIPKNKVKS